MSPETPLPVERLDESRRYDTDELCALCRIDEATVATLVEHGVVERADGARWTWHAVHRISRAVRVQREFEIELAAVPLVLDLLERIDGQRREIRLLRGD